MTAHRDHPALTPWRANIGDTIAFDAPPRESSGAVTPAGTSQEIDVLSWNVAIGKGRLLERVRSLQQIRARVGISRPLVVLVQEAFRSDDSVPALHASPHHGGLAPRGRSTREDIADVARTLGLSLRYAPSMRNGEHRSDRGNAIMTSMPIDHTAWITLPYVRQHRAVAAIRVTVAGSAIWFASAHLDTRGRHRPHAPPHAPSNAPPPSETLVRRGFGSGRATQAAALGAELVEVAGGAALVVGADLNSYLGIRDPAVRSLMEHGFHHATRAGRWRHTFHGPIRLMLDHVMYRPSSTIAGVIVARMDEGVDSGMKVFGSDHHPLLATITLR
jgi:endonuclease/exonuclease/phosphatase family metal-dependent hydrolase